MESKYVRVMVINLVVGVYLSYRYSVLSYLGVLMMIAIHELGHYVFAVIGGEDPKFIVSSGGNFGVTYDGERTVLISGGGMIVNFLFIPLFVGMGMMDMGLGWVALLIIAGSSSDIVRITRVLRSVE